MICSKGATREKSLENEKGSLNDGSEILPLILFDRTNKVLNSDILSQLNKIFIHKDVENV